MVFDILELENWKMKEFVYRNIKIIYLEINVLKDVQDYKTLLKECKTNNQGIYSVHGLKDSTLLRWSFSPNWSVISI